uniref:Uncharacterized protein n=1 Tax=Trichinella nativa TaxID=6335 RepID=A0A0V1IU24_9BILA
MVRKLKNVENETQTLTWNMAIKLTNKENEKLTL